MKQLVSTVLVLFFSVSGFSQDISGKWSGFVEAGSGKPTIFNFLFEKISEKYSTLIDIPAMRVTSLKPQHTDFKNGELTVDGSNIGFTYRGKYIENSQIIEGTFTEGLNEVRLNLKRSEIKMENTFKRPQEPVKPYPYKEEEVIFSNNEANVTISGTLTLPVTTGLYPVVILISGSGPQDRDETFYEHKPFLVLADYLTRQGIAVLRYDDRGAGKSTGNHSLATTKDFAFDVLSAIKYLKTRKDIDANKIGLIGHSEGGIIAPMVAHLDKSISFIVMLGATGIPGSEVSVYLAKTMRGFPVQDEIAYEVAIRKAIKIASSNKDLIEIKKELRIHYNETIVSMITPLFKTKADLENVIANLIEIRTSPWNRYFYAYNPAKELEKVTCPVLALNGSKDTQVQARLNQEGIRNALAKGRNKDYTVKELSNLNHLFQECDTGDMNEYSKIEQTIAPFVLKQISEWILAHTNNSKTF
jgi:pimeloyl-ACP methyl ester carboxylesterase